jgi:diguanylate cyclase (GGDEF)-like protein
LFSLPGTTDYLVPLMPQPVRAPEDTRAVETLAAVFRAVPAIPVIGEPARAAEVYRDYEGWSRHLLMGAPVPGMEASVGSGPRWAEAQRFFRERRQAEQQAVQRREREYGALAQDLLAALRTASHGSGEAAQAVTTTLDRVQKLLASNAVDQLRAEFAGMAGHLCQLMNQLRGEFDGQLQDLRTRVQAAEQARAQVESEVRELGQHLADMRAALDDARQRMQVDSLTGLFNRGAFDQAIDRYVELAQAGGHSLALLLIDLDHFKRINDTRGHAVGDSVLRAVGDLLSRIFLRADDFVARYGGEEFAVLLFIEEPAQVGRLVGGLRQRLRQLQVADLGAETVLSCSGGCALLRRGETGDELLRRADAALYAAKHAGRDCLKFAQ